jgi:hypothetical protein
MESKENKGVSVKKCLFLVAGLEVLIIILAVGYYGYTNDGMQAVARYSGRLSLFIFSAIFLLENNSNLIRNWLSKEFYLVFAVAHGIHLIELLLYVTASGTKLIPVRIAGGAFAYALIFIMPVIQRMYTSARIGKRSFHIWSQAYAYYVWFIFLMAYVPRVQGKLPQAGGTFAEHLTLLIFVCLIMFARVILLSKQKFNASTNPSQG